MSVKDVVRPSLRDRSAPAGEAKVRDLGLARVFPVFTVVSSIVYVFGVYTGYGPIRYYPLMYEVHVIWSKEPLLGAVGPPMLWYGWLINGAIAGTIAAAVALLIPADQLNRLWARWLWAPVAFVIALALLLIYLHWDSHFAL